MGLGTTCFRVLIFGSFHYRKTEVLVPPEKGRTKIINDIFSCIHWSLQSYNVALLMFGTLGMTATLQYLRKNYMILPLDVSRKVLRSAVRYL